MNISRFFIDRPIFAAVLSIVITLVGGLAILALPISEYPEVAHRKWWCVRSSLAPTRG
jgi:multidrug efflux pump subunit AcrB